MRHLSRFLLLSCLCLAGLPHTTVSAAETSSETQLVNVAAGAEPAAVAEMIAARSGIALESITVIEELGVLVIPEGAPLLSVDALPGVDSLEADPIAHAVAVTPNDPFYGQYQWGLPLANVDDAWVRTTGSSDVVIAVLDTGVSPVSEMVANLLPGYDFINDDADPVDDNGHGTESATVIAASTNDAVGMAGICWTCKILPVKVLGADGSGQHSQIAQGIVWATDQGADIINLSLGGTTPSGVLDEAVAYAVSNNVLVLAASGNNGLDEAFYPASSPGAVSVAASDENDARYSWSNFGPARVDLAAPGCNPAQSSDALYYWFCGTSSATPFVAGVAGLALSANPNVSAAQLAAALKATAVANDYTISGRVDAEKLLFESNATDAEQPVAIFTEPLPGRYLSGQVTASVTASDNASISHVHFYVDDTFVGDDQEAPWSVSFDTGEHEDGERTLRWRVFDRAGNVGVVQRNVFFDNVAPSVRFSTPWPSQPVSGTVEVTPDVTEAVAVRLAILYADGTEVGRSYHAPFTVSWDTTTTAEGAVGLKWVVFDRVGHRSVVSRTVAVDRTVPEASVVWPNPGRNIRGVVAVRTSISDGLGIGSTALIVDGQIVSTHAGAPTTITFDTDGYSGRTEVVLRVIDRAGNVTYSPIRVVYVDNTPPTVGFVSPNPSADVSAQFTVSADVSDSSDVARVLLFVNEQYAGVATSSPFDITADIEALPPGPMVLKLVVFDTVGNRAVTSRTVIWSG